MLNQRNLLNLDPFNFTGDTVVHNRETVILKGYWLWQVFAALLYRFWGLYGIFVLKGVTLLLLTMGILREMHKQSVSPFLQMILTGTGLFMLVTVFPLERPHIFSFIFATTLLGMVAHIRLGHKPSWMILPLMVLWANLHGGFIVGDILLVLFATGAVIQYRTDLSRLKMLLFWSAAGIFASFANPNGWNTLLEGFSASQQNVIQQVHEYNNSWAHFEGSKLVVLLWLIVALHIAGLFFSRKIFWPEILISVFLIFFGLKYMRNEGFIAVSLLPMTGWYLDRAATMLGLTQSRLLRAGSVIALSALFVWQLVQSVDRWKNNWPITDFFPDKMALFLRDSGLSGHLFNDYGRGGYLNWALYPKWQTFIDGRGLDLRVYDQYNVILAAGKNYEALLEQYKIDAIGLHLNTPEVRPQPLLKFLLNNPRWTPVYLDKRFFVLARNTEKNSSAIKRFGMDKKNFLDTILLMYNGFVTTLPDDLELLSCYTEFLIYAGRYPEAEAMLEKMKKMQADADMITMLRRQIDTLNVKK